MVLLVLALIWAVVLVPRHLRHRAENRPGDSVGAFQRQLSVLGQTGLRRAQVEQMGAAGAGVHEAVPQRRTGTARERRAAARQRRRSIVFGLLAAVVGSFALGFVPGLGVLHAVHLVLDVLFVAYVALLVRSRRISDERRAKVRHLPSASQPSNTTPPHQPAMVLRQYGS